MDIRDLMRKSIELLRKRRTLVTGLAAMVVFTTTYILILPALTLDEDSAKAQGGIDVPSAVQQAEDFSAQEEADAEKEGSDAKASEDAAQSDAKDTAAEDDSAPAEDVQSEPTGGVLTADGKGYSVSAMYDEKAGLPADTELQVNEILEKDEDYDSLRDKALAALQKKDGKSKAADFQFSRFFDMTLYADGAELEPAAPVDVTISYDKALAAENRDSVRVIHFVRDEESGRIEAEVLDPEKVEPTIKKEKMTETAFEAESFSVYGVVYTVEFQLSGDGYAFSLKGGDSISLGKLLEVLGTANGAQETKDSKSAQETEAVTDAEEVLASEAELSESTRALLEQIESVSFSNPKYLWTGKIEEDCTTADLLKENSLHPEYPADITPNQFGENLAREFHAPDWALISLKPFSTEETLRITLKNGETIEILVTDAADAVLIPDGQGGQKVQTIANPSGTTIDLFDYWITDALRTSQGMNGWPGYNGSGYSFQDYDYNGNRLSTNEPPMSQDTTRKESQWYVQNGHLRGNGNNQGINSGHVFKFYPGAAGTVVDLGAKGSHTDWTNNHDEYASINSWTGSADPTTGLIRTYLDGNGYPQLTNDHGADGTPLDYLFNDAAHAGKQRYEGVNDLLYVDPDGYYTYDSWEYSAQYDGASSGGSFTVREHPAGATDAQRGFWPFNDRVNWHGMHMTTNFSMPANGQVLNPRGEYKDMEFVFSGDDDTWLYVDGILVGDGGGIHNHTKISINFRSGEVVVTGTEDPVASHVGTYTSRRYLDEIFRDGLRDQGKSQAEIDAYIAEHFDGHTFKQGSYHKFEMFYLERGGSESNLYIHYNLVSTTDFSAHKSYHAENDARLARDQFRFELIGFDNPEYTNGFRQAIMPEAGEGEGTVASPNKVHYDQAPEGLDIPASMNLTAHTSLITGVTEDGNVNFGNVQVQASQAGKEYYYAVREIVPDDAVNADGIRWDHANAEQKEEGGFTKGGITYDGKVYYFKGTVRETAEGSGTYELKKTRYTDGTYSTVDTETKFFSFVNGYVQPLTLKLEKKSDSGRKLSGAVFTLVRAMKNSDGKWVVRTYQDGDATIQASTRTGTTSHGSLTFGNLTEGHYILEETNPPAGYAKGETSKWLLTMTKQDSATKILLIPSIRPLNADGTEKAGESSETLTVENDNTFQYEVLNDKLPRGDIEVRKKWLKPDGVTEYTAEELEEMSVDDIAVTGELRRRATVDTETDPPTVRIYSRLDDESEYLLRWQGQVEPGSSVAFSMAVNSTGYPIDKTYTTSTGAQLVELADQDIYYDYNSGNQIHKTSGHVFALNDIRGDVEIYGLFDHTKASTNNDPRIGFKMISFTEPAGSTQPEEIDEAVNAPGTDSPAFRLDKSNNWTVTWNSEQLNEQDYDYEYYLRNVSEPQLEDFDFVDQPETFTDRTTGKVTYALKNIKGGEKTDLTVRKVWADGSANHADGSITYKLQRAEYNAAGAMTTEPHDYIEPGASAAETYTLSSQDTYNGRAWQKHHTGLPADNGKDPEDEAYRVYRYTPVEVNAPAGYTVSYAALTDSHEGQSYEVQLIRNTPTDDRLTVEKKWMDPEQTEELTSGIPEGAFITGRLVRDYSYTDPDGVTVKVYYRSWTQGHAEAPELQHTYENVQAGSVFSLWAVDDDTQEPIHGVTVNDRQIPHDGETKTFNIRGATVTAHAFYTTVNEPTDIIIEWYYNTGYQRGVYYDVSYTQATGGGESHSETEDVGEFSLDASNDWKWIWTAATLNEDPTRQYTYRITDVEEHKADGTVVTNYEGFEAPDIGGFTVGQGGRQTAVITNVQELLQIPIRIRKVAQGSDKRLPNASFTLTQVDENGNEIPGGISKAAQQTDENGELVFTDLVPGRYRLHEAEAPAGYVKTEDDWFINVTADGNDTVDGAAEDIAYSKEGEEHVYTVENEPGAELPSAGGPGTTWIYLLGAVLLLGGGILMAARRRTRMAP